MTIDQQLDDIDEPTTTPETDEETTDEPDVQDDEHEAETGADDPTKRLRDEAAKYRKRAQAAERERDELTAQLAAVQAGVDARDWREVEAIAAEGTGRRGGIHDGRDLHAHLDLASLRGDDGLVSPARVHDALDALHHDRAHLFGDATWAKGSPSPKFQQKRTTSGGLSGAIKHAMNNR